MAKNYRFVVLFLCFAFMIQNHGHVKVKKSQAVLLDHKTVFLHIFVISWLRNIEKMRSWGLLPTRFLAEAKIPDQNMLVSFVHFVTYLLYVMAIKVVEFSRKGYKIRKVFGYKSTMKLLNFENWSIGELSS